MMQTITVATAAYPVAFQSGWQAYEQRIRRWVESAIADNARVLVFPEYFSMELASLFEASVYRSLEQQLRAMQQYREAFVNLYAALAREYDVYILAGTFPVQESEAVFVNRAFWFSPGQGPQWQDKLMMTRFEREQWHIQAGARINVFDTPFGRVGVNVCYDSEFPLLARQQVEQGADVILVPSCTDTLAGYHRVRIGCRARALENQCYVVQSATVGDALWSPAIDENRGTGAIYGPVDYGFPDDGVLAQGQENQPGWTIATLDLKRIREVREYGQVTNHRDWDQQIGIPSGPLK